MLRIQFELTESCAGICVRVRALPRTLHAFAVDVLMNCEFSPALRGRIMRAVPRQSHAARHPRRIGINHERRERERNAPWMTRGM
jgi:hypothetical protein